MHLEIIISIFYKDYPKKLTINLLSINSILSIKKPFTKPSTKLIIVLN